MRSPRYSKRAASLCGSPGWWHPHSERCPNLRQTCRASASSYRDANTARYCRMRSPVPCRPDPELSVRPQCHQGRPRAEACPLRLMWHQAWRQQCEHRHNSWLPLRRDPRIAARRKGGICIQLTGVQQAERLIGGRDKLQVVYGSGEVQSRCGRRRHADCEAAGRWVSVDDYACILGRQLNQLHGG
jgi:hypothetical protein